MTETDNQDGNGKQQARKQRTKKLLLFCIRWGIAIVGVWIVVSNMTIHDAVLLLDPQTNLVSETVLAEHAAEDAAQFVVKDPATGNSITVDRERLLNPPTQKTVTFGVDGKEQTADLLGMRLVGDINNNPQVDQLLVRVKGAATGQWIGPAQTSPPFVLKAPRPRVTVGIIHMVRNANGWLLALAIIFFPTTFIITSYRWWKLLQAVDVHMGLGRAFVINMVGAFYNTFMPGSTGGDVLKAWYAAKQTEHHKMHAVVSVVLDRIIGLLALVMVGGVMAALQYFRDPNLANPTSRVCFQVALLCAAIMGTVGLAVPIMFNQTIRSYLGFDWLLDRLPAKVRYHFERAREVLRIYRARRGLLLWAVFITIPVHVTVVLSALVCGSAFGLDIQPWYYFTIVPVIVLAGSIPISPQGAGVMEITAIQLTKTQGTSVTQAVALTLCIRVVQILWNLTGGIFVLRGGYHAPTESEQKEMERDQ